MSQIEPSIEDLKAGALAILQNELNTHETPPARGVLSAILTATAGLAKLCMKYKDALLRNSFAHLADNDAVLTIAKEYGVFLHQDLPARINIKVTASDVATLPALTIFEHASGSFISSENIAFVNNIALVPAIANDARLNQKININDTLKISQLFAADQSAHVQNIEYSGQDKETIEQLRRRLLSIIRNQGPAGSQPYYIRQTLLQDGVNEAFVYRGTETAQVMIYPIMAHRQMPDEAQRKRLLQALSSEEISLVGDFVQIGLFQLVHAKIHVRNLAIALSDAQAQITAAIESYIESKRPMQHLLEPMATSYLSTLDIYGIISQIGATNAQVQMLIDGHNVQSYDLKGPATHGYHTPPQLAVLTEVIYD